MSKLTDGLHNVGASIRAEVGGLASNPIATAIGGAVAGGAIVGTIAAATRARKKRTRKAPTKRRRTTRRSTSRKRRSSRERRSGSYARTAGKRRDTSTRRIRMTKNGQPYIILRSGKARFIKKSGARSSRRRKGGRY